MNINNNTITIIDETFTLTHLQMKQLLDNSVNAYNQYINMTPSDWESNDDECLYVLLKQIEMMRKCYFVTHEMNVERLVFDNEIIEQLIEDIEMILQ